MIDGELLAGEDLELAGPDIGRGDAQLDPGAGADNSRNWIRIRQRIAQGIGVEGVGIVGVGEFLERFEPHPPERVVIVSRTPIIRSKMPRCMGVSCPPMLTRCQKASSLARAPSAPPACQPSASAISAFIAPAEAPEIASMARRPSSSSASSTPQVKAPCEPPP